MIQPWNLNTQDPKFLFLFIFILLNEIWQGNRKYIRIVYLYFIRISQTKSCLKYRKSISQYSIVLVNGGSYLKIKIITISNDQGHPELNIDCMFIYCLRKIHPNLYNTYVTK